MPQSLLRNGDWSDGALTHWTGEFCSLTLTGTAGHHSKYTCIVPQITGGRGYLNHDDFIPVTQGKVYEISWRYNQPNAAAVSLVITPANTDRYGQTPTLTLSTSQTTTWRIDTSWFVVPPGCDGLYVYFDAAGIGPTGDPCEIDWICIREIPNPRDPLTIEVFDLDETDPVLDYYWSDPIYVGGFRSVILVASVITLTGTDPTVNVALCTYDPDSGTYHVMSTIAEFTAAADRTTAEDGIMGNWIKVRYLLGGTDITALKMKLNLHLNPV